MGAYSKLHKYVAMKLQDAFPRLQFIENYHPNWLLSPSGTRLELDIFIPEMNIAIEIQGQQHFTFIGFFHKSYAEFEKQKEYDEEKRNLCYGAGVRLVEICTEKEADIFIREISPENEPVLSKLQKDAIRAIERNDKSMADSLCRKCLKQLHQGKEKELHSSIVNYLKLI
jgi:hypothetical protein